MPAQLDSLDALDRLGVRLDVYAGIEMPTVLLGGDRNPREILDRLDAVGRAMPRAERVMMRGRDHGADLKHPRQVAGIIAAHADNVLDSPGR